jgi:hypothetical protein
MRKVLVESPFAPKSKDPQLAKMELERNIRYVRAAMRDCFLRGEAPFASHALYTLEGILDDTIPEERTQGIEAGLLWGEEAEVTVVYEDLGISKGMELGIKRAHAAGRPVERRSLPGDWSLKMT